MKKEMFECPEYVIALLKDINNKLEIAFWNANQKEWVSPFENTGTSFIGKNFEVHAYKWETEKENEPAQPFNFKYKNIEISWYKTLGRDTTVNKEYTEQEYIKMYNDIIHTNQF